MRHRIRIQVVRMSFVVVLLAVLGRITYVQAHDHFISSYEQEWQAEKIVKPMRGTIYDANGDRLAFSVSTYDLDMDLPLIRRIGTVKMQELSAKLAKLTGASSSFLYQQFNRTDVAWLRLFPYMVHVSWSKKQKIVSLFSSLGLSTAINPHKTYERIYPDGEFAAHVIGFVNQSQSGASGIELAYNSYLAGKPGTQSFVQDNGGVPIPFYKQKSVPVQNGDNVYLTINPAIQHFANEALYTIEKRFTPAHASIIVSNPYTGAILAMADLPHYNPNQYWLYPASTLDTNWAISAPFEPGSTFKIVTLTGALATHSINLSQTYMSGVDYVNGVAIRDWNLWGWGRISYLKAFIYSSNTGFIHIGQAEGVNNLYHYIHLFGMNQPTGIDLPGESTSILFPQKNLNPVDFATMTFGQGLAVTPIQQIQEVGAVANRGNLIQPYLVQKIVSPSGKVIYQHHTKVIRQVAPKWVMNEVTNAMVQVVANNPYEVNAYLPGYNIAGKTGTAQIANPNGGGYLKHKYNLSFIGFVPANHPQLAIYATVNEPHNTIQYGNSVASPAARFVLEKSLAYLQIPPSTQGGITPHTKSVSGPSQVITPNLLHLRISEADALLSKQELHGTSVPTKGTVIWQWPKAGTSVNTGTLVTMIAGPHKSVHSKTLVPDFKGIPMKEAIREAGLVGLQIHPNGDGYAVFQSIPAGKKVGYGTAIKVNFSPLG